MTENVERERLIRYGMCEFCGAARDVKVEQTDEMTMLSLWCPTCGREAD